MNGESTVIFLPVRFVLFSFIFFGILHSSGLWKRKLLWNPLYISSFLFVLLFLYIYCCFADQIHYANYKGIKGELYREFDCIAESTALFRSFSLFFSFFSILIPDSRQSIAGLILLFIFSFLFLISFVYFLVSPAISLVIPAHIIESHIKW